MKNLIIILITIISFASCKKEEKALIPQPLSTNTTTDWTQINNSSYNNSLSYIGTILFLATDRNGMFKSSDNGNTWVQINNGLGSDTLGCQIFSNGSALYLSTWFSPNGSNSIVKVFQSTNNGTSWSQIWTQIWNTSNFNSPINTINFFGSNILIGTSGNSYKSNDNGVNWSSISSAASITKFVTDGTNFFGSNPFEINKSIDNGTTFSVLTNDSLSIGAFGCISAIGTNIYTADGTSGKGVYKSSNSGINWMPANNGLTYIGTLKYLIGYIYSDGTNLYAGTGISKVLISTNMGTSWSQLGGNMPGSSYSSQFVIKSILRTGGYTYAIANGKGLFKIAD